MKDTSPSISLSRWPDDCRPRLTGAPPTGWLLAQGASGLSCAKGSLAGLLVVFLRSSSVILRWSSFKVIDRVHAHSLYPLLDLSGGFAVVELPVVVEMNHLPNPR